MAYYLLNEGYLPPVIIGSSKLKRRLENDHKEMRRKVQGASIGRAMFVTSKGFIGLAPLNAKQGDIVSVLLGGCTPFLLRKIAGTDLYNLDGEDYVYGMMGGELLSGQMGTGHMQVLNIV